MLNKVQLIGRVGKDPESFRTDSGLLVVNMSIATNEKVKDENITEWHNLVFFDKLAEIVANYVTKGTLVYVEGKIQTRKYTDKEGIERYSTKIICNSMKMLSGKQDTEGYNIENKKSHDLDDLDDDIPF